jgi:hydrogenase 3 maturation protease
VKVRQTMKLAEPCAAIRRIAVVGMGHELRGDDAAGIAVARALQTALGSDERLLVIDAGPAPENYTGPLRHFEPDLVLFVDAAQMDEAPGTIRWVPWREVDGLGVWTHALSPRVLACFLIGQLGCEVTLLCIQPSNNSLAASLSPEVADAVDTVVLCLLRLLAQDWALGSARSEVVGLPVIEAN